MLIKKSSLFYQRPYHKPTSQLIWIETQLTVFIRMKRAPLNRNKFSNQISLFNVSKNDFLQVWWFIICLLQVCEDFLFANEKFIPQQEFLFLKLDKAHYREFLVQKNHCKIFLFPMISQSMHIFFFSIQQPWRGVLGKYYSWKYVSFPDAFFPVISS